MASAVCMTLAYPGYEQYHYGGHELGGYESGLGESDYGHHGHQQISRIGESHGHELSHHHEEEEHVDYYVSVWCWIFIFN